MISVNLIIVVVVIDKIECNLRDKDSIWNEWTIGHYVYTVHHKSS